MAGWSGLSCFFVLLSILDGGLSAIPKRYLSMDSRNGAGRSFSSLGSTTREFPKPRYVTQRLDHYDGSNPKEWQQAYYVNDTFFKPGTQAPVFLCVGGEGPPLDGSAVVDSVHCNIAVEWLQDMGALMFALEHRYYGCHNASACPVSNLSAPGALRFHSSRQALGDIAGFVQYANKAYKLNTNKWVTWGGSYPGMLAGWARLKFPHLIHASISSSAPVRAELDMRGYNDVVSSAYAVEHERVGGSQACRDAIATGHRDIGKLFGSVEGREKLTELFGQSPDFYTYRENQRSFAGEGVADFPAQGNDPACDAPMCNIARICAVMTDVKLGDELQRLAHIRKAKKAAIAINAQKLHEEGEHSAPGYNDDGWLLWPWQTCTEFGFYQTCEVGSACFFTQGLESLDDQMGFCEDSFGISKDQVASNIAYTNSYYGSDTPEGSRVLYVNGEVDPWHANSINAAISQSMPALYVAGASHHAWTHPSLPTDQDSVVSARLAIRRQVELFLKEPRDDAMTPSVMHV